jgi:small subunit ribosomal protein S6
MLILDPDSEEGEMEKLIEKTKGIIEEKKGEVEECNKLGKKRLPYEIKKKKEGIYFLVKFKGEVETIEELERNLRLTESVLRFMTTRRDLSASARPPSADRGSREEKEGRPA